MKKKKTGSGKEDMFLRITAIQMTVTLMLFGVIFFISRTNSTLFAELSRQLGELLEEDFDYNDFVPFEADEVFGLFGEAESTTDESTTENQQTQSEAESLSASEECTSVEEKNTSVEEKNTSAEEENTSAEEENTLPEEELSASGGEDLSIDEGLEIMNFEKYSASENAVYPVNGKVTSEFGYRTHPIYGTNGLHSGKDIAAKEGTNIYCVLDGRVIETGVGEKSGNYIKVEHNDGVITLYAHCKEILVSEGIRVRKGEKIALVGQTGLVTGPHLHFEVIINSEKCDPDFLLENAVFMDEEVLCVSK